MRFIEVFLAAIDPATGNIIAQCYGSYAKPDIPANKDSAPHCIHAGQAGQGFPHDPVTNGVCNTLTATNQFDAQKRLVTATGTYGFYIHDQGDLTEGSIKIQ